MSFFVPNDRRHAPRANLAAPCPSFFHVQGRRYQAFMVDVSSTGAGFRNFEHASPVSLGKGQGTRFDVITPYGKGTYKGTVAWCDRLEGGHAWGLRLCGGIGRGEGPLEELFGAAFPPS